MTAPPTKKLRGIRSLCRGCGQYFNGVSIFDQHRVGPFAPSNKPNTRRCLTVSEMTDKGWRLNAAGFWTSGKRPVIRGWGRIPAEISAGPQCEPSVPPQDSRLCQGHDAAIAAPHARMAEIVRRGAGKASFQTDLPSEVLSLGSEHASQEAPN